MPAQPAAPLPADPPGQSVPPTVTATVAPAPSVPPAEHEPAAAPATAIRALEQNMTQALPGRPAAVRTILATFLAQGHLLLHDVPEQVSLGEKGGERSEEHTSELQSRFELVC